MIPRKKSGVVRVYADVVCDLFHAGHVRFFEQCRALGDELVVGVHDDDDVASYKRTPIMTLEERLVVVAACRHVDYVRPHAPLLCTIADLDSVEADFAVHGDDMAPELLNRLYAEPIACGRLRTIPYTKGISTSDLISRILVRYSKPERC